MAPVLMALNSEFIVVLAHRRRLRPSLSPTFLMLPERMPSGICPPHKLSGEAVVRAHKRRRAGQTVRPVTVNPLYKAWTSGIEFQNRLTTWLPSSLMCSTSPGP
jgi:hypothetical protein